MTTGLRDTIGSLVVFSRDSGLVCKYINNTNDGSHAMPRPFPSVARQSS